MPVNMMQVPGDANHWYVVEKAGFVRMFDNKPDVATTSVVVDVTSKVETSCAECGLLGMAFHPDFPATPLVYLSYTSKVHTAGGPDSVLSEFTSRDGGLTIDPTSERVVLTINKTKVHHHGGRIAFGPDKNLYLAMGDGNSGTVDNAQKLSTLLGKVIRIDIRGTTGTALYQIPADNPFAASTSFCNVNGSGPQNCPEIYAWGFRNPWGWSFDRQTGDLWVTDVGEATIEEVNRVKLRRQLRLALLRGYTRYFFGVSHGRGLRQPDGSAAADRRVHTRHRRPCRRGRLRLPGQGDSGSRGPLRLRRLRERANLGHSQ